MFIQLEGREKKVGWKKDVGLERMKRGSRWPLKVNLDPAKRSLLE